MKNIRKLLLLAALITSTSALSEFIKDSQVGRVVGKDVFANTTHLYLDFDNYPKTAEAIARISTPCATTKAKCFDIQEGDVVSVGYLRSFGREHKDGSFFGIGYCSNSHSAGVFSGNSSFWDEYKNKGQILKIVKKEIHENEVVLYLSPKKNPKKVAYVATIETACPDAKLALFLLRTGDIISDEYVKAIGYGKGHSFFSSHSCPYFHTLFFNRVKE